MKHTLMALVLGLMIHLIPLPAYAHKVTVFAWVEGETIHTESKFSGSRKVKGGKIEIYDHRNQKVLEGTTDDKGYFAFPTPQDAHALRVVLTAGMGHSNHWEITSQELGRAAAVQPTAPAMPSAPAQKHDGLDAAALEAIVERAVEKKMAPMLARVAEQAWGLRDIVAGIGYILGLMGLASYIHYRKANNTPD